MNILDLPSSALADGHNARAIQWPTCSRDQVWGEALTADSEVIQAWARHLHLSANPGLFTEPRGLLMEWEFRDGCATVWVEGRGTPFFDALLPEGQALDPSWVHACFQACLPQASEPLGLVRLRSVQETQRTDALCFAWSVGAVRFAFVRCDERLFYRLSWPPGLAPTEPDVRIGSRLHTAHQLWTAAELRSLSLGDGVVLSRSSAGHVKASWLLGNSCSCPPLVNWNWSANTMTWTGEHSEAGMTETPVEHSEDGEGINLDDVKIPITFEVASGNYALSALNKIRPGQAISLDCQPQQCTVKMVSLGRTLASGQLVQIGDSLALRIDRLHVKSEGIRDD